MKMPIDSKEKIFRELMEQYGTDLLRLCCMYLRDYQLAEDAVQDTFIKVYRGLDQFLSLGVERSGHIGPQRTRPKCRRSTTGLRGNTPPARLVAETWVN